MNRSSIINTVIENKKNEELTIIRSSRFKKHPFKSLLFYSTLIVNRLTPFLFPIKSKVIWGQKFQAYESSAIGSIFYLGFYDSEITLFLLKYFKETGDLIDIGSNIGYYASLFTQISTPEAKIIAFEPTPSTFAVLKRNVGQLPNVTVKQIALSDKIGEIPFYDYGYRYSVFNSSTSQTLPFLKNTDTQIKVPTDTLDNWCQTNNIHPSLIKLDTEGTESYILKMGLKTISTYNPLILLEVGGGEAWSKNTNDCLDILSGLNYDFFELDQSGNTYPHIRQKDYSYKNLVCIPRAKVHQYVQIS